MTKQVIITLQVAVTLRNFIYCSSQSPHRQQGDVIELGCTCDELVQLRFDVRYQIRHRLARTVQNIEQPFAAKELSARVTTIWNTVGKGEKGVACI